jgi:peptidoglycan hydrolase-like protein with peptidoglycan-binding domain
LRYVSGDNVPAAVAAFTGGAAPIANLNTTPPIHDHKALQEALKAKGFYKGAIDGQMNQGTTEAVKAFKVANKLAADSVVGPKVKELLGLK